jgi:hypothetical protein
MRGNAIFFLSNHCCKSHTTNCCKSQLSTTPHTLSHGRISLSLCG